MWLNSIVRWCELSNLLFHLEIWSDVPLRLPVVITAANQSVRKRWNDNNLADCRIDFHSIFELPTLSVTSEENRRCVNMVFLLPMKTNVRGMANTTHRGRAGASPSWHWVTFSSECILLSEREETSHTLSIYTLLTQTCVGSGCSLCSAGNRGADSAII